MNGKYIDITKYIKAFDLQMKMGPTPQQPDRGNFVWSYVSPTVDANLKDTDILETLKPEIKSVMKMEQRGKYWFDKSFEVDVKMSGFTLNPDGNYSATYEGMNFIDTSNKGVLARFLRWILRR